MSEAVTVAEVMTRRVQTGTLDEPVEEIWDILVEEGCHHIPILDQGRLVDMVSTFDRVELVRQDGGKRLLSGVLGRKIAADVMATKIERIHQGESVDVAIDRIGPGEFYALLVVDDLDALAGIVTHHDLLHFLAS
ncbi:MAG: CBS domain-containing protein [bacterium]|nr:CBS domain-containing protein [bacterium]